jgi:hypothetical protein
MAVFGTDNAVTVRHGDSRIGRTILISSGKPKNDLIGT